MITFLEHQTQTQINTALAAGGFTKVGFAIVGPDSQYQTGSVTVQLITASGNITGYRTSVASIAAGKTYVSSLISGHTLTPQFNFAIIDDGQGVQYTAAQAGAW